MNTRSSYNSLIYEYRKQEKRIQEQGALIALQLYSYPKHSYGFNNEFSFISLRSV